LPRTTAIGTPAVHYCPDYTDVFGIDLNCPVEVTHKVGDLVTVGGKSDPVWRVIAINGPTAWVGRIEPGLAHMEGLTPLSRLFPRKAALQLVAVAA
jgi:hypothetical protein